MIVYAVTTLDVLGDPILGNRRTPAIYTTLKDAIAAVKNNDEDLADDGLYQYAVIEETLLNTVRPYIQDGERLWFRYNAVIDEFEECDAWTVPSHINRLYGFSIG